MTVLSRKPGGSGGGGAPSGPAGGDLAGSYPNPTLGADSVDAAAIDGSDAAAIRTELSVPSTTEAILDSIVDAKGDLIAGTAADTVARLAVAANGSLLRSESGQATGLEWQLNNPASAVSPAVGDDSGDGYSVGSLWYDTTSDRLFVCLDASVGAAIWQVASGRQDLVAQWDVSSTKTDIGTAYVDIYTQTNAVAKGVNVDFIGKTQFRTIFIWNKVGAGTQMGRVCDGAGTNVVHEFTNLASGSNDSGFIAIPAAFLNTSTFVKLQAKSSTSTDDPVFEGARLWLK